MDAAQAKAVWTTKKQKIVLFLLAVFWSVTAISALLADEKMVRYSVDLSKWKGYLW